MTVSSLNLRDTDTGETSELAVQGMFVAIGYKPNTDLFVGQLDIGPGGYLDIVGETGSRWTASSWPATSTTTTTGRR